MSLKSLLFLLALSTQITFGQSISEKSFAIAEFSNETDIRSILSQNFSKKNFGLSIKIIEDPHSHTLKVNLEKGNLTLESFLDLIKIHIEQNKNIIFPLFVSYEGEDAALVQLLKSTGLLKKTFYQPKDERWPDINAHNKSLILFKTNATQIPLNNTSHHILESSNNIEYSKSNISNELLSVKYFTNTNLKTQNLPEDWNRISVNPYCIDYLMNVWNKTGKRPNFIFYSSLQHKGTFYYLSKILNETPSIKGKVIYASRILKGINWSHDMHSFTNGYWNFPHEKNQNLNLKPLKEGYRFTPTSILLTKTSPLSNILFKAQKLNINDNLTAFYKFNNSLDNEIQPEKIHENTPHFINDKTKNTVLKFENENIIKLKNVSDYKIVNSSFTIAIDFKYDTSSSGKNICLIGSDEQGFRKGLHINLIKGKPVFGFYTSDVKSDAVITPDIWHRFVAKYNIDTETQSMYIDGKLLKKVSNKPSFIGSSTLLLGQGIKHKNHFSGYLDNLQIWNRALSEKEIKWLENNSITISALSNSTKFPYYGFILALFGLTIIISFIIFQNKKTKKTYIEKKQLFNPKKTIGASLNLFGKFSLVDASGKDYSTSFSPKIKELFLLVLLRTTQNKKGISTSELTAILWKGFETSKAANNRGVSFNALKKTLKDIEGIDVIYENKLWKIKLNDTIFFDYKWILDFTKTKQTRYYDFFEIVKRGEFLSDVKKEWLLEERSNLNFDIIDLLLLFCKEQYHKKHFQQVLEITAYVQKIDELNLQALYYQLNSLSQNGSKNKVVFLFDNFCKKYETINAIPFPYDLRPFLQHNPDDIWDY